LLLSPQQQLIMQHRHPFFLSSCGGTPKIPEERTGNGTSFLLSLLFSSNGENVVVEVFPSSSFFLPGGDKLLL